MGFLQNHSLRQFKYLFSGNHLLKAVYHMVIFTEWETVIWPHIFAKTFIQPFLDLIGNNTKSTTLNVGPLLWINDICI